MKLKLEPVVERHRAAVDDFMREWRSTDKSGHTPGAAGLDGGVKFDAWLGQILIDQQNPSPGRVRATQFAAVDEHGRIIGFIQLRHELNEQLLRYGGHIGYSIRLSERRKGYGTQMLELCLDEAERIGIEKVLITCDEDNVASQKLIQCCGGVLENILDTEYGRKRRYWIDIIHRVEK